MTREDGGLIFWEIYPRPRPRDPVLSWFSCQTNPRHVDWVYSGTKRLSMLLSASVVWSFPRHRSSPIFFSSRDDQFSQCMSRRPAPEGHARRCYVWVSGKSRLITHGATRKQRLLADPKTPGGLAGRGVAWRGGGRVCAEQTHLLRGGQVRGSARRAGPRDAQSLSGHQ